MNIQIKFLLILICLFGGINPSTGRVNSTIPSFVTAYFSGEEGLPCYEPAPVNFHVTEIFTDHIRVAWDAPPNNPFEYNIKVFETSSGNLLQNFNIPGNLTVARTQALQPGTEYTIRNTPVCPDGTLSTDYADLRATTLIVDLVANGFTPNANPMSCNFTAKDQFCYADPDPGYVVTFRVKQVNPPYRSRYFGVYTVNGECLYTTMMVRPVENGSPFQFFCVENLNDSVPNCSSGFVKIKFGTTEVAELGFFTSDNGTKALFCSSFAGNENAYNYIIERFGSEEGSLEPNNLTCGGNFRGGNPSERNAEGWEDISTISTLSANPNPFTNQLDIQIPFANINENIDLNLYDLQGRRVLAFRSPGDQQTITLDTEKLSPGMYFLRAESGGIVQTVKVVKTE